MLREYVFKTASRTNLLCTWTKQEPGSWIVIQLLRGSSKGAASGAIFTLHASDEAIDRFLRGEFAQKYGTYEVLSRGPGLASVEVTNYLLPAYRGADPVILTTNLLGRDAHFAPLLVHAGYLHIKVIAAPQAANRNFAELLKRLTVATHPEDFQLIHTGEWNPLVRLNPRDDGLSPGQTEALKVAVEFGYYDDPRRCTLEEIAKAFGVSKAAIHKRLLAAESKILKNYGT